MIAPNDDTAYSVIEAAGALGLEPGRDYGLIGYDDNPRSRMAGLTTVRRPVEAMGEEAGRLLLRALRGEHRGVQQLRMRSHVIARASTARSAPAG